MSFEDIIAGVKLDSDGIEREAAVLNVGKAIFAELDPQGSGDDPELIYLITASLYASHFVGVTLDELLPPEAVERIYRDLKQREEAA